MHIKKNVPIVTTDKLAEVKAFYQRHFSCGVSFENEQYLGLVGRGQSGVELAFMVPEDPSQPLFNGAGITYALEVADPDAEHNRLTGEGLSVVRPLQDNPWGDRSFVVVDPVGVMLYIYKDIVPAQPAG